MPRLKKRNYKSQEEMVYGPEPTWDDVEVTDDNYVTHMVYALNWYNVVPKASDKKSWLIDRAEELGFTKAQIRKVPDSYLGTVAAVDRLVCRGFPVRSNYTDDIQGLIQRFESFGCGLLKPEKVKPANDETSEKLGDVIGEYEDIIEEILDGKAKWIIPQPVHKLNGVQTKVVMNSFKQLKDELMLANSGDDDFTEAYPQGKRVLNRAVKAVDEILQTLDQSLSLTKAQKPRKARKRKIVPATKHVAKMNYQNSMKDGDFTLQSIDPEKIIGAKALLVFNTKTRQLAFYHAGDGGFGCKGTTLNNFTDKSSGKTVRKPAEKLPVLMSGTIKRTIKGFKDIKAVAKPLTGRINKDCILMRVFK